MWKAKTIHLIFTFFKCTLQFYSSVVRRTTTPNATLLRVHLSLNLSPSRGKAWLSLRTRLWQWTALRERGWEGKRASASELILFPCSPPHLSRVLYGCSFVCSLPGFLIEIVSSWLVFWSLLLHPDLSTTLVPWPQPICLQQDFYLQSKKWQP